MERTTKKLPLTSSSKPDMDELKLSDAFKRALNFKQGGNRVDKANKFFKRCKINSRNKRLKTVFQSLGNNKPNFPYYKWSHIGCIFMDNGQGCITCGKSRTSNRVYQVLVSTITSEIIHICGKCCTTTLVNIDYDFTKHQIEYPKKTIPIALNYDISKDIQRTGLTPAKQPSQTHLKE